MIEDLQKYLTQARKLKVVDAQPEVLTFMAAIDDTGVVVYKDKSIRVAPGYMFACEQIKAGCPIPPSVYPDDSGSEGNRLWVLGEFLPYISFNVLNEGLTKSVFKTPLTMEMFINALGSTEGLKFNTPITFFEGADISIDWFVDLASLMMSYNGGGIAAWRSFNPGFHDTNGETYNIRFEFYVHLIGSIIRAETVS